MGLVRGFRPLVAAFVAFGAFGFVLSVADAVDPVPCSDARGCPDLVVDPSPLARYSIKTETFAQDSCAVVEGSVAAPGARRLLKFTSTYPNIGLGDLIIGSPADHPEWFELAACHQHYHFREYADYRLWTPAGYDDWQSLRAANPGAHAADLLAANPNVAAQMVASHKQGFCVIDVERVPGIAGPKRPVYTSCASNQGISRGWADSYSSRLDGQWIDITGMPAGNYFLEVEVNAEHLFTETNYANNSSAVPVKLR